MKNFIRNIVPIFSMFLMALARLNNDSPQIQLHPKLAEKIDKDIYKKPLPLVYDATLKYMASSSTTDSTHEACPDSNLREIASHQFPNFQCIFPEDITDGRKKCLHDFKPRLVESNECSDGEGILYSFQYDICYKNIPWAMNTSGEKKLLSNPILIYSFCYNENKSEVIYTMHTIKSKFIQDFPSLESYEQENSTFKNQLLIPYIDIDPVYARYVNLIPLNQKRQHPRLDSTWNELNETIWHHLDKAELHRSTTIYTKTTPSKWVKLLRSSDGKAIVIVLYDISNNYNLKTQDYLCSESICKKYNWTKIEKEDKIQNIHVQCCEATEEIVKKLQLTQTVGNITDVLKLPDKDYEDQETSDILI